LPLCSWVLPHAFRLSFTWRAILFVAAAIMSTIACKTGNAFIRSNESNCWCSTISYSTLVIAPLLLFPLHPQFCVAVLAVLALGDGSAALGGILLRGPKLPWNPHKTWAGSCCFLIASIPAATVYFWVESLTPVTWLTAFTVVGITAVVCDLVESLPSKINDNIRVGLTANLMLIFLQFVVIGW
jgi:dolichol kinase